MGIEFGGKDFVERSTKEIKRLKPAFDDLDALQRKLLEKNGNKIELLRCALELHNEIERFSMSEFFSANYRETPQGKLLKELSKKCYCVKSQAELDAIISKFQEITGKSYEKALEQKGINASAGIVKTAASNTSLLKSAVELSSSDVLQSTTQLPKVSNISSTASAVQKTFDRKKL